MKISEKNDNDEGFVYCCPEMASAQYYSTGSGRYRMFTVNERTKEFWTSITEDGVTLALKFCPFCGEKIEIVEGTDNGK